jgi:hypothetical protein
MALGPHVVGSEPSRVLSSLVHCLTDTVLMGLASAVILRFTSLEDLKKIPRANYADLVTAACRQS